MKKSQICFLLGIIVCIVFLAACATDNIDTQEIAPSENDLETETTAAKTPTGYPKDEVGWVYLYFRGQLWEKVPTVVGLPSDAEEVGTVKKIDNKQIPAEEGAATHLEAGARIYYMREMYLYDYPTGEKLLVERLTASGYDAFVPFTEDPAKLPVTQSPTEDPQKDTIPDETFAPAETKPGVGGEELLDIPVYSESDLFFNLNNDGFYLGRDVACYYNLNAGQNSTRGIQKRIPTSAIRLKDNGDMYSIYETDGYRMYLFYDRNLDYAFTIGFPVVVKELLQFSDFAGLKVGDSIETVEAVDPVAGLYRKLLTEVWQLDAKGAKGQAAYGYPCTSIHYLSDGLLKIEYDMPEDGVLVISGIEFAPDYILTDPIGRKVDYKIEEKDLPEQ